MNRDRGVIKWTAMMLPEHVQKLKELQHEQNQTFAKEYDEQTFEEWNRLLAKAYQQMLPISLTIHTSETEMEQSISGTIKQIDSLQKKIYLSNETTASTIPVFISTITSLTIAD